MYKISTLMAIAVFALAVGFAGTAKGDPSKEQLTNPGAEDPFDNPVLSTWTVDNAAGGVVNEMAGALTENWFFATDLLGITPGASVTIAQDVDVTGCRNLSMK